MKHPLHPDRLFDRLEDVTPEVLQTMGITALVIDLDNTLVPPHTARPTEEALAWLKLQADAGIGVFLVSNNTEARVNAFCEGVALPHLHRGAKPLPFGITKARKAMGAGRRTCALLGDQILTDVLGARLAGIRMLMVKPMVMETGSFFKLKRAIERRIMKSYHNGGNQK